MRNVDAIIVASGKGTRTGRNVRKQYIEIDGLPLMCYALKAFDKCEDIRRIYLAVPKMEIEKCKFYFVKPLKMSHEVILVAGGSTRQSSVLNALEVANTNESSGDILIHDAVRPFVTEKLISKCIKGVKATGACVPVVPVADSLKKVDYAAGSFLKSVERENIWFAQTPQAFDFELILKAHCKAKKYNLWCTDDSKIAEISGISVSMIQGLGYNIKVTTEDDLIIAEAIAKILNYATNLPQTKN